jgi:hypothetical protein
MPSNAPLGAVSVYVSFGGFTSPPNPARIVPLKAFAWACDRILFIFAMEA